ncbi:MAG: formate dehydrogenase, partial [Oscillospiraceae bacterium]|nr:formate dehydrogenase [Oscillospiraceae bacterium]
ALPGVEPYVPGTMLKRGLATPTGKYELYSESIAKIPGLDPLPTYVPPRHEPERFPYLMSSSPRITGALHSRLHSIPWARTLCPEPTAEIHPLDAEAIGLSDGDMAEIESAKAAVTVRVKLTHRAERGVICFYHGYPEADANTLTDGDMLDPYSGFPCYRETPVNIRRVTDGEN